MGAAATHPDCVHFHPGGREKLQAIGVCDDVQRRAAASAHLRGLVRRHVSVQHVPILLISNEARSVAFSYQDCISKGRLGMQKGIKTTHHTPYISPLQPGSPPMRADSIIRKQVLATKQAIGFRRSSGRTSCSVPRMCLREDEKRYDTRSVTRGTRHPLISKTRTSHVCSPASDCI